MEFNAFEWIRDSLAEELSQQGFEAPEPLEDQLGPAAIYRMEDVAYSLLHDKSKGQFCLRSTTLKDGEPGDWRMLSNWLFSEADGQRSDAESILNDFLEIVRGPKRVEVVQQKKKRSKEDERNVDPLFFINRLPNIFPEIRDRVNEEKITYGQVRAVTFIKENVTPLCEDLLAKYPESEPVTKLCALLDDMYQNGDLDLRAVITYTLLDGLSESAFNALQPQLGEALQKAMKYSRKLIGKKIKPEKKKKQKKVVAKSLAD